MEQYTTHRVVIIEDNVELNDILGEYIKTDANLFLVASYTNCEKAIKNLAADQPKVVLMDIDLPGMNGAEGTKKIKALLPKTEVIIINSDIYGIICVFVKCLVIKAWKLVFVFC